MPQQKICKKVAELRATMSSHLKLAKVSIWHISKTGVLITCHFVPILTWFKKESTKSAIRTKLEYFSQTLPLLCSKVFRVSFFETLISDDKKKTGHNVFVKSRIEVPKFMIYFIATEQLSCPPSMKELNELLNINLYIKLPKIQIIMKIHCSNLFPEQYS